MHWKEAQQLLGLRNEGISDSTRETYCSLVRRNPPAMGNEFHGDVTYEVPDDPEERAALAATLKMLLGQA
jgi:hypothetical protein